MAYVIERSPHTCSEPALNETDAHCVQSVRLINFEQLKVMGIPWSREHLWRLEAADQFPRRLCLSPNRVAWLEHEVIAFIDAKAEERAVREYRLHD